MRREPLLLPFCALAAGIGIAAISKVKPGGVLPVLCCGLVAVLLGQLVPRCRRLRFPGVCVLLFVLGAGVEIQHRPGKTPQMDVADGETAVLSGCVIDPPVLSPGRAQFTLQMAPAVSVRVSTVLKDGATLPIRYGQRVDVTGKVRYPRNFGNPDAFDYIAYLAQQHIYWTASVASASDVQVTAGECGSRLVGVLFGVRSWALRRIVDLYPNDQHTVGLLQATLLGVTGGVERRWTEDFRVTGTYHALVISGQHVSIFAGTILFLLSLLHVRRLPALATATTATWMYAFLTGMSSPVVRAAGGFTLFLFASLCFRKTRILNVLAAVGLVYLLVAPEQLFDPSFQLSFLSAAAIAGFAIPAMERWTRPLRAAVKRFDQASYDPAIETRAAEWRVELRLLAETIHQWSGVRLERVEWVVAKAATLVSHIGDVVLVSACVQFGLALPMVAYFHRLSLTGLTANIVVIPLLSAVVPLGFGAILTGLHPLAWLTAQLLHWAEWIAAWHAQFEPAWRMAALPVGLAVAFAVSLAVLGIAIRREQRITISLAAGCAFVLFACLCVQPWRAEVRPGWLEVTAIDVSQGDAILVVFPNGKTMLVDAGGFPGLERMARKPQIDMGEDVVSPYLWSRRIRHLDYVALSHGHSDHMAGLPAVLDNFQPAELWIGPEPESAEWETVRRHAAADHVRVRSLHRGAAIPEIAAVQIRALAPEADYAAGEKAENDDSLVLEFTYGKRSALLEGDAEFPSEAAMMASGELKPVTLLKVAHHGSKTSSGDDFLSVVRPEFAIISDGYHNQFHHPHPVTLAHLAGHNVNVFRTDEHGLVQFLTDGDKVELGTYR